MKKILRVLVWICLLGIYQADRVQAQQILQQGSFTLEKSQLNQIRQGELYYEVPAVGNFSLSSDGGNLSYEESGWFGKKNGLLLPQGKAVWSWVASDPETVVKVTRIFIEGGSQGAGSTVRFEGTSGDWWLQPAFGFIYRSEFQGKAWQQVAMEVITRGINISRLTVDYEVVPVSESELLSENEKPEPSRYVYAREVVLDRSFTAGWNTVCLPFDCRAEEICPGAVAQEFVAYQPERGLDFALVETMEANKPYMIYCPEAVAQGITLSAREVYGAHPVAVTFQGMTFVGNYEPLWSMAGYYGVAQNRLVKGGSHSFIRGTRAYFEMDADASAQVYRINYQPCGGTTGMEEVMEHPADQPSGVYNLQGVLLRRGESLEGLPAGMYIVGGRTVLKK